jgi:hypothetical protein
MLDILLAIPGKKRATSSGWHVFNGVCCHNRGHNRDKRSRAGVKFADGVNWSYSCFNCGFKCSMQEGRLFSGNLKQLLTWCGLDGPEIDRLSFQNFSAGGVDRLISRSVTKMPEFETRELPAGARPLNPLKDAKHIEYLRGRAIDPFSYPFHVVDGELRERIILPYYWRGQIVGNTSRYYDGKHPKYLSSSQRGYVFGVDNQRSGWNICILVEGQFDALSIGGCAVGGSSIGDEQATVLKSLNRRIIFVPDRDKTGLAACDRALELGFSVSIPAWTSGIKDVNDAVKVYGKLPTLLSIIQAATTSRIKVELLRKKIQ